MGKTLLVISDLHLGGKPGFQMCAKQTALAAFPQEAAKLRTSTHEVHLVLAGDIVDFLVEEPFHALTAQDELATQKPTNAKQKPFRPGSRTIPTSIDSSFPPIVPEPIPSNGSSTTSTTHQAPAQRKKRMSEPLSSIAESASPISSWTFLSNHGHVLLCLARQPHLPLREVAHLVGITERSVQRIVYDLESAGYLVREREGRRNTYRIEQGKPLRHPIEQHCNIGDLIRMVQSRAAQIP